MTPFLEDLCHGFRLFRRAPVAVFVPVLSLGFGIGATTAARRASIRSWP